MATEPKSDKNLYQRMSAVMEDVKRLQKDKAVGSGNYAYKAISEEKVSTTIRESMIRHGLVVFPIDQVHTLVDYTRPGRNGEASMISLSTVDTKYKIVNIDNPSEFEVLASSGTGVDPQDKGVGKAMTYSMKYLLMRTFLIPTGNDPDDIHNEDLARQQEELARQQKQAVAQAITQIEAANTPEEVKAVFKKGLMANPEYKAAADKAIQRAQSHAAPATEAVGSDAAANAGEPQHPGSAIQDNEPEHPAPAYATASQKEEIIRLLNHPVISRPEKTKMLLNINRLNEEKATEAIRKLKKAIEDRENGQAAAA